MASSRTSELVSIITSNTGKVEKFLSEKGLPDLSFDPIPDSHLHQNNEVTLQRQAVLNATDELNALMLGPKGLLMSQPVGLAAHISWISHKVTLELIRFPFVTDQLLDDDASNSPIWSSNKASGRYGRSDICRTCHGHRSSRKSYPKVAPLRDDIPHLPRTSQRSGCPYSSVETACR